MSIRKTSLLILILVINIVVISIVFQDSSAYRFAKRVELSFDVSPNKTKLLLFMGYVGCPSICPTSLGKISQFTRHTADSSVQVVFVNLIEDMHPQRAKDYATSFHPDFMGIQPNNQDKKQLIETLNAFYSEARPEIGRETGHADLVYFFTKDKDGQNIWNLQYVVTPSTVGQLTQAYEKLNF